MNFSVRRLLWLFFLCGALWCDRAHLAHAQLATSFYNVTGISTRVLPNAVQLTIQTDGTVAFGGDLQEFIDLSGRRFRPKTVTSFRLRLLHARARLPAFINIGQYPVDAAVVTLGRDQLSRPFFSYRANAYGNGASKSSQNEAQVDIQLRFFVPVTVQRFLVDRESRGSNQDESDGDYSVDFSRFLGPRDVAVELGRDRRSILVTIITDRLDAGGAQRLQRSPIAAQHHRLAVKSLTDGPAPNNHLRIDALHTALAEVLGSVSQASGLLLVARPDAEDVDVSLLLPDTTPEAFLHALEIGYGLVVAPRTAEQGGGFDIGRSGADPNAATVSERLPLYNLEPERARLLFPDFLLPLLHADKENNALIVSGSPALVSHVRRDLTRLDLPRAQVKVEVSAWQFTSTADADYVLNVTRTSRGNTETFDTNNAQFSLLLKADQKRAFTASIQALISQGRVRLAAKPFVVVASGEHGTLFLGQSRYIKVLRVRGGFQQINALRLDIGYSLTVRPIVGALGDITLELNPRVSTVDEVEAVSGLPTVGIREVNSVMRVRPQEAIIVAGLDSDLATKLHSHTAPFKGLPLFDPLSSAKHNKRERTALVLLVTAEKV